MLALTFMVGDDRYALDGAKVMEVAPLAELRTFPRAPAYVAGLFNYRGTTTPVVDMGALLADILCRRLMSTRIILVDHDAGAGRGTRPLGLMAERVTETMKISDDRLEDPGVCLAEAPYLGRVVQTGMGMIQLVHVDRLLDEKARQVLFAEGEAE